VQNGGKARHGRPSAELLLRSWSLRIWAAPFVDRSRSAASGKPKVVVTTAIAREMVGFIWAIAHIAQPALD
jgi:hypothetical protein